MPVKLFEPLYVIMYEANKNELDWIGFSDHLNLFFKRTYNAVPTGGHTGKKKTKLNWAVSSGDEYVNMLYVFISVC